MGASRTQHGRLRSVLAHLQGDAESLAAAGNPVPAAAASDAGPPRLLDDAAVKNFIMKGWMSISPDEIGLPRAFHKTVYDKMSALHNDKEKKIGENTHSAVPEVHEVMAQPAVAGALQSILGEGYALHPHTFTHIKDDVGADQDW